MKSNALVLSINILRSLGCWTRNTSNKTVKILWNIYACLILLLEIMFLPYSLYISFTQNNNVRLLRFLINSFTIENTICRCLLLYFSKRKGEHLLTVLQTLKLYHKMDKWSAMAIQTISFFFLGVTISLLVNDTRNSFKYWDIWWYENFYPNIFGDLTFKAIILIKTVVRYIEFLMWCIMSQFILTVSLCLYQEFKNLKNEINCLKLSQRTVIHFQDVRTFRKTFSNLATITSEVHTILSPLISLGFIGGFINLILMLYLQAGECLGVISGIVVEVLITFQIFLFCTSGELIKRIVSAVHNKERKILKIKNGSGLKGIIFSSLFS